MSTKRQRVQREYFFLHKSLLLVLPASCFIQLSSWATFLIWDIFLHHSTTCWIILKYICLIRKVCVLKKCIDKLGQGQSQNASSSALWFVDWNLISNVQQILGPNTKWGHKKIHNKIWAKIIFKIKKFLGKKLGPENFRTKYFFFGPKNRLVQKDLRSKINLGPNLVKDIDKKILDKKNWASKNLLGVNFW